MESTRRTRTKIGVNGQQPVPDPPEASVDPTRPRRCACGAWVEASFRHGQLVRVELAHRYDGRCVGQREPLPVADWLGAVDPADLRVRHHREPGDPHDPDRRPLKPRPSRDRPRR